MSTTAQKLRDAANKAEAAGGKVKLHPTTAREIARELDRLQVDLTRAYSDRNEAWFGDAARRNR